MEQKQIFKQIADFNQAAFNNTYDATVLLQDQFESIANNAFEQFSAVPSDGRKATENLAGAFKESRKNFKQQMDNGFEQAEKLFIF